MYQLRPDFLLPYLRGKTDEIEKALSLSQFGVPMEAIAYVFGPKAMYWYRAYCSLSRASLVGTTVKNAEKMPEHLLAEEKPRWLQGKRVFIPTTVAQGCFLGVSLTESASPTALTQGYREFKEEVQLIDPDYTPITLNTDPWSAKTPLKFLTGLRQALMGAKKQIRKKKTLGRLPKLCRRASKFRVA